MRQIVALKYHTSESSIMDFKYFIESTTVHIGILENMLECFNLISSTNIDTIIHISAVKESVTNIKLDIQDTKIWERCLNGDEYNDFKDMMKRINDLLNDVMSIEDKFNDTMDIDDDSALIF